MPNYVGWVFECGCELDQSRLLATAAEVRQHLPIEIDPDFYNFAGNIGDQFQAHTSHFLFLLRSHVWRECVFPTTRLVLGDSIMRFQWSLIQHFLLVAHSQNAEPNELWTHSGDETVSYITLDEDNLHFFRLRFPNGGGVRMELIEHWILFFFFSFTEAEISHIIDKRYFLLLLHAVEHITFLISPLHDNIDR